MMESKLDVARYNGDEERRLEEHQIISEELRMLKDSSEEMQQFSYDTKAAMKNKADLSSHERALRQLQELQANCANKVDIELFKMLQDSVLIAESNIEGLQNAVNYKAGTSVTDQHTRQIEQIGELLSQKTEEEQTIQLQSELSATETNVEALQRKMHDKADLQDHERHERMLQDLTNSLHGKTDLVSFKKMEKSYQKVYEIAMQAESFMRDGVQVTAFEQMKENLQALYQMMQEKADTSALVSTEKELENVVDRMHHAEADLKVRRAQEAEMKANVQKLMEKSKHLSELSHILVSTKADATNVPHLHDNVLEEIRF
jgi:hypothetical protein